MDRKLIVTLLQKDIRELEMITEGFMEMNEYPKAIIHLAERKIEDIQGYIMQLSEIKADTSSFFSKEKETVKEHVKTVEEPVKGTVKDKEPEPAPESVPDKESANDKKEQPAEAPVTYVEPVVEPEVAQAVDAEPQTEIESVVVVTEKTENVEMPDRVTVTETVEVTEVTSTTETMNDDTRKTILQEKISSRTQSRHELLGGKVDNSLSSTLANKKINDIKQAINIGDRFRFQRELFRGNGEDMNKTLNYINQLATFEEVHSFLQSKYGWDPKDVTVEDFYQIVKRRFL